MALKKLISWFHALVFSFSLLMMIMPNVHCWPEGTFGLPMPKIGCPVGAINEWESGTRTQVTERGSHASDNVHLAGIETSPSEHIVQLFCMKMFYPQEENHQWMPGKYCIFKKGDCPDGFSEGSILWDDAASWYGGNAGKQSYKGVLPDGDYNHNTRIYYCCRTDGPPSAPIVLPSSAPFYLLKFADICQEVEGMAVTEEWVYWADESTANVNREEGSHPKLIRGRIPKAFTKLFYCYYQPKPLAIQAYNIIMILVYIAAAVIGMTIITCVIICLISRLCHQRRKRPSNASPSPEPRSPHPSTCPPTNPPHAYRYIILQTNEEAGNAVTPSAPPLVTPGDLPGELTVILRDQDFRPNSMPPSYEEVIKSMAAT